MTSDHETASHPRLLLDRSFWGLNLTQFLGAFNDNLFKQLVMLLCVDRALRGGQDLQGLAMILFAWPFIAFSGFAGFLSDRYSKRTIIVLCKLAEIGIVLLGLIGFVSGSLSVLLGVLCLMGVHSAFFGPSKYGILPEMLRPTDLPRANGTMLMATFLAIIFGLSAAGAAKQAFHESLWLASLPCLLIAVIGLMTSLLIRPTRVAHPQLDFDWSSVAIATETRQLLKQDRTLLGVLLMSSVFWFVGGTIYPPTINAFGKDQLRLDDLTTGAMAASTGLGIAIGCVLAGLLSKDRVRGWLVRAGAWGLTLSLLALSLPGPGFDAVRDQIHQGKSTSSNRHASRPHFQRGNSRIAKFVDRALGFHFFTRGNGEATAGERWFLSSITLREKNVPLHDVLNKIGNGFDGVIESRGIALDPEALVSIDVDNLPVILALDELLDRSDVEYAIDDEAVTITTHENLSTNEAATLEFVRRVLFHRGSLLGPYGSVVALIAVGLFAGLYSVPLQVYLQTAAPSDQKGRIIGAMNLLNWIGIAGSGVVYSIGRVVLVDWLELPHATLFGFAALLMLPVALFYRPPETQVAP